LPRFATESGAFPTTSGPGEGFSGREDGASGSRTFDASGLNAGKTYDFKVIGRNSIGEGPESAVKSIDAA
jgi:hypothetical protein